MGSHCSSICGSKPKRDAVDIERKYTNPTVSNDSRQDYPAPPNLAYAQSYHASRQDFVHNKSQRFFIEYELKESIGVGTYGEVHRAIHKETGQERAVKIIEKEKIYPKEYGKLMEEVKILLGLDHPSILKIYDLYEDANHFYMVSELLKGGELFDRIIEQKHLTEQGAAKIMRQVLSAIAYCHKYGVIHRDLKPENVIFDCKDSDTVKIIDFGLAQTFRPNQRFHECIGTAYYIAPEVVESQYDEKCDIWSCGVILYVMLSGRPPFSATNDDDVLNQVRFGEYDFDHPVWSEVSHEAKKLIKRMMKLDPKKRYSAQEALQDPWFKKYLEANPIDQPLAKEALSRLGSFRVGTKLQEATWIYLVSYFSTQEELNKLWHAFKALDQNNDGQLTKEDLTNAYIKIMGMTAPVAEAQADKIIATLDIDRDGRVNYTEFINAAASKQNILTKERLERAFKIFDKKGDGEITADELKDLFNHEKIRQIPGDIWKKWIEEVDKNKDGKISLEEFKNMMLNPIPVK